MKSLFILLFISASLEVCAQTGLQGIFVEPYYVTSKADHAAFNSGGPLEEGAVTYRIFVDLEPGYRFQAAYGSPDHPLEISSDHVFFNHNHSGNTYPNIIPERDLARDIVLLDSWVTAGAATENHLGIPRKFDFLAQDGLLRFKGGFLENTVRLAEDDTSPLTIKLSDCDGLARTEHLPVTTIYNMDSLGWAMSSVSRAKSLVVNNGAWACMGKGSVGADSLSGNHVLIAQVTTAGKLDYKLNIMIGTPEGKSIQYVYANPQDREVLHPSLTGQFIWQGAAESGKKSKGKKSNKKS
ncbi:MAG: hypothetical protein ACK478_03820 [Flavobacteriales bacterium]|jgi:hypothetical protein